MATSVDPLACTASERTEDPPRHIPPGRNPVTLVTPIASGPRAKRFL